jgi:hypothetical protein
MGVLLAQAKNGKWLPFHPSLVWDLILLENSAKPGIL